MQKVERKQHTDRRRGRLTAVLLCALLLIAFVTAGILLTRRAEEKPPEARKRITGAITQRSADEVRSVTVKQRNREAWTAVPDENGTLRLQTEDGTENWSVDESLGRMLMDVATNLTYEDVFTENRGDWEPEAESFGLRDPLITATFRFTDGTEVTARIGNSADGDENAYYYLAVDGDDRLYAVSAGTVEDLNTEQELLRPVHRLEILSALLDRITVKNGDGSLRAEWELQGKVSDRDAAENWLVKAPFVYPADYDAVQNLKDSAENLRLGIYIGKATEENLKEYGLEEPQAILEMHMAAGSTGTVGESGVYDVTEREERTETLTLGKARSDMVDYVRFGDGIYTISRFSVSVFTEHSAQSTAARYPVATPLNSLESATVEKQGAEAVHYALIRTDRGEAEDSGTAVESGYRCMKNGEEIPWDTFEAAWERLLTVTVSGRLPEGYQPGEPHTKYTFRTVSGGTHTVALCDYDGMHDAVTMDGHTLFYLIQDGMTALP